MVRTSIRLGRIAGIDIGINYSLLLIGFLVTWQVGSLLLPEQVPGYEEPIYLFFGAITALLFFASILWHELAHALMATHYGVKVRRIVLFFLGGIAEIEEEPRNPTQDFWIAFIGPLSSVVLGGLFWLMRFPFADDTLLSASLYWLAFINVFLAGFNMLPGFPLDGGRVARAILWWLTGNYLRATRWTAFLGQAFAVIAVVAGFFSLSQNSVYLGDPIWNFLIAMFLWQASRGHLRSAEFRENLRGVPIGNLVRHSVPLKAEWPLAYAADIIAMGGPLSALPVMQDGQLVGVLSMDLLRNLPRMGWGGVRVEDIMQPINSVRTIDANIDLYEAIRNTDLHDQRVLLVTKQQNPIGLLSQRELLAFAEQHSRST